MRPEWRSLPLQEKKDFQSTTLQQFIELNKHLYKNNILWFYLLFKPKNLFNAIIKGKVSVKG